MNFSLAALPKENVKEINKIVNLNLDSKDYAEKVLGTPKMTKDDVRLNEC